MRQIKIEKYLLFYPINEEAQQLNLNPYILLF